MQGGMCGPGGEFIGRMKVGSWFIWLTAVFGFGGTQTPDMLVQGGGGSVMVWGCVSYDCKLDLITIPGALNAKNTGKMC